jgi:hypothetical protein
MNMTFSEEVNYGSSKKTVVKIQNPPGGKSSISFG